MSGLAFKLEASGRSVVQGSFQLTLQRFAAGDTQRTVAALLEVS